LVNKQKEPPAETLRRTQSDETRSLTGNVKVQTNHVDNLSPACEVQHPAPVPLVEVVPPSAQKVEEPLHPAAPNPNPDLSKNLEGSKGVTQSDETQESSCCSLTGKITAAIGVVALCICSWFAMKEEPNVEMAEKKVTWDEWLSRYHVEKIFGSAVIFVTGWFSFKKFTEDEEHPKKSSTPLSIFGSSTKAKANPRSDSSSHPWLYLALILLVIIGVIAWVLSRPAKPEPSFNDIEAPREKPRPPDGSFSMNLIAPARKFRKRRR